MAIGDIFKTKQYKADLESVIAENKQLKSLLTPEMQEVITIKSEIERLNNHTDELNKIITDKNNEIKNLDNVIVDKQSKLICMDDEILVQEFGLYQPKYDCVNAEQYKNKLQSNRNLQKELIKTNTAVTGNTEWTVNGSKSQGTKMVKDMQKLLLRAFNSECDELINKVKYNNYDVSLKRITTTKDSVSKLGTIMNVTIHQLIIV